MRLSFLSQPLRSLLQVPLREGFFFGLNMKKPTTKKAKLAKVGKVMSEFKKGTLHSGKSGNIVKSTKQGIAIALSEAGMSKKKKK